MTANLNENTPGHPVPFNLSGQLGTGNSSGNSVPFNSSGQIKRYRVSGQLGTGNIGVFDSGAGGLSVLAAARQLLPNENFNYFGDSAYTPYGEKDPAWVINRSREITTRLLDEGAKAIVIACNTATSVAAAALRQEFSQTPIIGVEPALKPAAQMPGAKNILVMATPMTLSLEKYKELARQWGPGHDVHAVQCPGLAARIEQGNLEADDLAQLLQQLVGEFQGWPHAVVLGCTHYSFIGPQILSALGPTEGAPVSLFDGAEGTARQLQRVLQESNLQAPPGQEGAITLQSSNEDPSITAGYLGLLQNILTA